jgi:hypothetical protein
MKENRMLMKKSHEKEKNSLLAKINFWQQKKIFSFYINYFFANWHKIFGKRGWKLLQNLSKKKIFGKTFLIFKKFFVVAKC